MSERIIHQPRPGDSVRLVPLTAEQRAMVRQALETLESLIRVPGVEALRALLED